MDTLRNMAVRLYHLRTHRGLSQRETADLLGVERSTYTKYESGKHAPSFETLKKLRELFGVSYDDLLEPQLTEEEKADYEMFRVKSKK